MQKQFYCLACLFVPLQIFADQCQWVTWEEARKAVEILNDSYEIIRYCEPCGDREQEIATESISFLDIEDRDENYFTVLINGEPVDLAYVFVGGIDNNSRFYNLANLVTCPTVEVSNSIIF